MIVAQLNIRKQHSLWRRNGSTTAVKQLQTESMLDSTWRVISSLLIFQLLNQCLGYSECSWFMWLSRDSKSRDFHLLNFWHISYGTSWRSWYSYVARDIAGPLRTDPTTYPRLILATSRWEKPPLGNLSFGADWLLLPLSDEKPSYSPKQAKGFPYVAELEANFSPSWSFLQACLKSYCDTPNHARVTPSAISENTRAP